MCFSPLLMNRPAFIHSFVHSDEDDCIGNICQNGVCVNGFKSYTCDCDSQWTGVFCEIGKNYCGRVASLF